MKREVERLRKEKEEVVREMEITKYCQIDMEG